MKVIVVRPRHPFEGKSLDVFRAMKCKGRLLLTLILPDGSKSFIPAEWTDLALPTQSLSTPNVLTLGSLESLLHARAVVDALLGRLAPVIGEDTNSTPPRRATLQNNNRNLFDLLLDQSDLWETISEEQQDLAIQILTRLMVQVVFSSQERKKNDE